MTIVKQVKELITNGEWTKAAELFKVQDSKTRMEIMRELPMAQCAQLGRLAGF